MKPTIAKAAKDIPTIWPVFKFPRTCEPAGARLGDEPDVMTGSDSPGRVVMEDATSVDVAEFEDVVSEEEDAGGGNGSEADGIEGAPVALEISVAPTVVVAGAPIVGGRADENGLEPGVN